MNHEIQPTSLRRHRVTIVTAAAFTVGLSALLVLTPAYRPDVEVPATALADAPQPYGFLHAPADVLAMPPSRYDAPIDAAELLQPPTY